MRRGFVWLLVGTGAALVVFVALGAGASEWLSGALGAAVAGVAGAVAPAIWDWLNERRLAHMEHRTAAAAATERLEAVSDPVILQQATDAIAGDVLHALRPERGAVEFVGRALEVQRLCEWCRDEIRSASRLALVTGAGGVGKTRLALRVAQQMSEEGWSCRWVRDGQEAEALPAVVARLSGPVLLLVDYAETRPALPTLLTAAANTNVPRLRVLLLARSEGEWWNRLEGARTPLGPEVTRAVRLPLTSDPHADRTDEQLVTEAIPQFARALGVPAPARVEVELHGERVPLLVLHAAALVSVLRAGEQPDPAPMWVVADMGVLDELLRHETRYWRAGAQVAGLLGPQALDTTDLHRCIAATSLLGAEDEQAGAKLLRTVPGLDGDSHELLRLKTARWLAQLHPGPTLGSIGSVQPDLLAEHHITTQLHRAPALAHAICSRLQDSAARRALTVLARAHTHQPLAAALLEVWLRHRLTSLVKPTIKVAVETPGPLGRILADVLSEADLSRAEWEGIAQAIPYPTVALADAHLIATRRIVASLSEDAEPQERAPWLDKLSVMLDQRGYRADALASAEEALGLYRELAQTTPERYIPELAASLHNLGALLGEVGREEEALEVLWQAMSLYPGLVEAAPERYTPELASNLNNLSLRLARVGRTDEALEAAREAVRLHRGLVEAAPERYTPELASCLTNFGNRLARVGNTDEALEAAREAVRLHRGLVEAAPERYTPVLASALNNLGNRLARVRNTDEALEAAREAVRLNRGLVEAAPERYTPELASCLNNLALRLAEKGDADEALEAVREAVGLRRALVETTPERYTPELAGSLSNLGLQLAEKGRAEEGLEAAREALHLHRMLVEAAPERYTPDLLRSLITLGHQLADVGRVTEAEHCWNEAERLRSPPRR